MPLPSIVQMVGGYRWQWGSAGMDLAEFPPRVPCRSSQEPPLGLNWGRNPPVWHGREGEAKGEGTKRVLLGGARLRDRDAPWRRNPAGRKPGKHQAGRRWVPATLAAGCHRDPVASFPKVTNSCSSPGAASVSPLLTRAPAASHRDQPRHSQKPYRETT